MMATATDSNIDNRRGEHGPLRLYVSNIPWSKLSRRWELNTSLAKVRRSSRPSLCAWARQVCPAFSSSSGSNSPPGGDQWTAQPLSSPECPKHAAEGLMFKSSLHYNQPSPIHTHIHTLTVVSYCPGAH
ncbi:hypothetical protein AMECASPLE_039402 [Ameca splendens]|uniref:Uncharacterized protein n=1 Tax=Ameca splendens TaxID=208324 RepID=A0ABV1A4Y2_9TELE